MSLLENLCHCQYFSGYSKGYICIKCKKPIYTEVEIKAIDKKRKTEDNVNALLDVENLASRFHQVYQNELRRQNKKSKYSDFYSELPKEIKDLDRALAKYVIKFVIPNCQKIK